MKKGLFITLEGIEGAGKTTNLKHIQAVLEERGGRVEITREPGGTPLAEEIRELLLVNRDEAVSPNAELLMIFAARAQHLEQKILPLLEQGVHVISDRFTDATYAYQGGGRGLSWSKIQCLEELVLDSIKPDLTFLFTIDPELGMKRARKRGSLDRFEQEKMEFYHKVQQAYLKRAGEDAQRFCLVDGSLTLQEIKKQISAEICCSNRL